MCICAYTHKKYVSFLIYYKYYWDCVLLLFCPFCIVIEHFFCQSLGQPLSLNLWSSAMTPSPFCFQTWWPTHSGPQSGIPSPRASLGDAGKHLCACVRLPLCVDAMRLHAHTTTGCLMIWQASPYQLHVWRGLIGLRGLRSPRPRGGSGQAPLFLPSSCTGF